MLISLLFISFILLAGFLIYQNTSRFYQERLDRANYIRSQIDLQKALTAFASIDSGIYRINTFLQDRGLKELRLDNAGGIGADFDIVNINEFADFYETQVLGLEETLDLAPIGKPADGDVTSPFGYRRNPFTGRNLEFHTGMDFRGHVGDSVKTTGRGRVIYAGYRGGYGKCIIIEHDKNLRTLYGHLCQINVKEGDSVISGQLIGLMGSSGRSSGPHLHYEIIYNGKKIDPKKYVSFK
jgi:murein DD-endopeptidase MepM/ murein hydrolase activator NlpD